MDDELRRSLTVQISRNSVAVSRTVVGITILSVINENMIISFSVLLFYSERTEGSGHSQRRRG